MDIPRRCLPSLRDFQIHIKIRELVELRLLGSQPHYFYETQDARFIGGFVRNKGEDGRHVAVATSFEVVRHDHLFSFLSRAENDE